MPGSNGPARRRILGADIGTLGREELVTLARAVCGQAAAYAGGHGNIHPENIFMSADGSPWLGGRAEHAPGEWTTDELEYMAPELFWSGALSPAADVYSVGLLLYAGVTRGRLPFFPCAAEDMTNEQRAAALRRRMNGEAAPVPTIAGEKLGAVLRKALAFEAGARYRDTIELSMALESCVGEGDAAARAIFGKSERELSEVERTMAAILASYGAEEAAGGPEAEPQPVRPPERPFVPPEERPPVEELFGPAPDASDEPPAPEDAAPGVTGEATAPEEDAPGVTGEATAPEEDAPGAADEPPAPEEDVPGAAGEPPAPPESCSGGGTDGPPRSVFWLVTGLCVLAAAAALLMDFLLPRAYPAEPVPPPTPLAASESPEAAETPSPTPSAAPSPTPEPEPEYGFYREDISWTAAELRCRTELGGRLAVIDSAEELAEITAGAEAAGIDFLWVGFYRSNGELHWIDGSDGYFAWGPGEPSVTDTDGTPEDYGLLWRTDEGWIYNDSRNDPAADYPGVYSGRIGFVCES